MKHNPSMQMTVMSKVDRIWILNTSFKMADEDTSLDELIEQAQALLEQEKPRKRKAGESEFEFYRDSVSGYRINKHKYRPRSRKPSEFSKSETYSNFEGLIVFLHW